jgi:NADH:ubiquinone oxidoreductase subunit 3 (subunit A)
MQPLHIPPEQYLAVLVIIFVLVGLASLIGMLIFSWMIRPLKRRPRAEQTYECGYEAKGDPRAIGFNFMHYAVLFLVFDIAAIYLFLYAFVPNMPVGVTISFLLGIATLGLMILYGTKKRRYYAT